MTTIRAASAAAAAVADDDVVLAVPADKVERGERLGDGARVARPLLALQLELLLRERARLRAPPRAGGCRNAPDNPDQATSLGS